MQHITTEFRDVLDIQNFLDFWANILIKEEIREKYRAHWLSMVIMLIECTSNCYAECLGRIGTLTRTQNEANIQETKMLMSQSSCDKWMWENHLEAS